MNVLGIKNFFPEETSQPVSSSAGILSITSRVRSVAKNIFLYSATYFKKNITHKVDVLRTSVVRNDPAECLKKGWKDALKLADPSLSDDRIAEFVDFLDQIWGVIDKKLKDKNFGGQVEESLPSPLKPLLGPWCKKGVEYLQNTPLLERNMKEACVNLAIASAKKFPGESLITGIGITFLEKLFEGDLPPGELTEVYFNDRIVKIIQFLFPQGVNTQGFLPIGVIHCAFWNHSNLKKLVVKSGFGNSLYTFYKVWRGLVVSDQEELALTGSVKGAVEQLHSYGKEFIQKSLAPESLKKQQIAEFITPYFQESSRSIEKSVHDLGASQRRALEILLESRGLEFIQSILQNILGRLYDKDSNQSLSEQIINTALVWIKKYPRSGLDITSEERNKAQQAFLFDLLAGAGLTKEKFAEIPILQQWFTSTVRDTLPRYVFTVADEWLATDLWKAGKEQESSNLDYVSGGSLMSELAKSVSGAIVGGLPQYCSHRVWIAEQLLAEVNPDWSVDYLQGIFTAYLKDVPLSSLQSRLKEIESRCRGLSMKEKLDVLRQEQYLGSDGTKKLLDKMGDAFARSSLTQKISLEEYLQAKNTPDLHRIISVLENASLIPKSLEETYKKIRVYTNLQDKDVICATLLLLKHHKLFVSEEELLRFFLDRGFQWKDVADLVCKYYSSRNSRLSLTYSFCENFKYDNHLQIFTKLQEKEFSAPSLDLQKQLEDFCLAHMGQEREKVVEVLQQELTSTLRPLGSLSLTVKGDVLENMHRMVSVAIFRWLHYIATKYPAQRNDRGVVQKDTPQQIAEKFVELVKGLRIRIKEGKNQEEIEEYLLSQVYREILCLDDADLWSKIGLPNLLTDNLKPILKSFLKQKITLYFGETIAELRKEIVKRKNWKIENDALLSKFGKVTAGDTAQVIVKDISSEFIVKLVKDLFRKNGLRMIGDDFLQPLLQRLSADQGEFAPIFASFMKYERSAGVGVWLAQQLQLLGNFSEDDQSLAEIASILLMQPVVEGLNRVVKCEEERGGRKTDIVLMTNLFKVAKEHFSILGENSSELFSHQKLQSVSPSEAVRQLPEYSQTIEILQKQWPSDHLTKEDVRSILNECMKEEQKNVKMGGGLFSNEDLIAKFVKECAKKDNQFIFWQQYLRSLQIRGRSFSELVREEAFAIQDISLKNVYQPLGKDILSLLFPEGVEKGISFLPKDLREVVKSSLEDKLVPMALRSIVDVVLQPEQIENMILTGLTNINASLAPSENTVTVRVGAEETLPEDSMMQEFYTSAGEMVQAALKYTKIPPIVKKRLETEAMKQKLGQWMWASLSGQLNGKFIENSLRKGLETMATRDPQGKKVISYGEQNTADRDVQDTKRKAAIRQQMRHLPSNTLGFFIRSTWVNAQAHFDRAIESLFGKVGLQVKAAFDWVFHWIFLRILGTVLSYILLPFKKTFEFFVGNYLESHLLRPIFENITKAPADQPATQGGYQAFAERLVKEIHEAIQKTLLMCPIQPVRAS